VNDAVDRVVVLAGSAGALPTMFRVVRSLDSPDAACLLLAYHRAGGPRFPWEHVVPDHAFAAVEAGDPVMMRPNTVYYPRLSDSMMVEDGLVHSIPEQQRPHPNLDRLLMSVAASYGDRVWAFLLSGMGSDGVEGLREVRAHGGRAFVEHPLSAEFPQLPSLALQQRVADEALDWRDIVPLAVSVLSGVGKGAGERNREGSGG
jgi:chemotaxis response regulator CheB